MPARAPLLTASLRPLARFACSTELAWPATRGGCDEAALPTLPCEGEAGESSTSSELCCFQALRAMRLPHLPRQHLGVMEFGISLARSTELAVHGSQGKWTRKSATLRRIDASICTWGEASARQIRHCIWGAFVVFWQSSTSPE
ncbi:unnamed protein product [Symbiodinium natans]|uniref:Uncharacterized protein n=1 Tax=Symbiodinium natans TaxID=878477 RepID=A0A812HRK7_9DINO|nr:unnamed protein product [Symbiodinium natans]